MALYLIALIPNLDLRNRIEALKLEIREKFGVKHALKSPAHITLQKPFKRIQEDEPILIRSLQKFASGQTSFQVDLSGFGCFPPRVLFVNIKNHKKIISLHAQLNKLLIETLGFKEEETNQNIHPHITIATRDLSEKDFKRVWKEFETRVFETSFLVKSIFLLKHNGKIWDIFQEFQFDS